MGTVDRGGHGRDETLVGRAREGDAEAFAALVGRDVEALRRFCRRLIGPADADDLIQETLIRAWRSIGRLGAPYHFRAWLFGIAANVAQKWWRRRRLAVSLERLFAESADLGSDDGWGGWGTAEGPEMVVEGDEERRRLGEALDALPATLRRVLVLHYLEGQSYAEIAAALAVPLSTVKGRLFKSRRRLRGELSGFCEGVEAAGSDLETRGTGVPTRKGAKDMDEPIRIVVDREQLIDRLHAYVTDPHPGRAKRLEGLVLPDLFSLVGRPARGKASNWLRDYIDVMVLEGVRSRRDVADLLAPFSLFGRPFTVTVL